MKRIITQNKNDEISSYSNDQIQKYAEICNVLRNEIDKILTMASSRIYYSMPVWFIDENPVVGYKVTSKYVNLLFWNGQAFREPELIAAGKFKAAQIKYTSLAEVNLKHLRRWLKKSKVNIWDYKNIRKRH